MTRQTDRVGGRHKDPHPPRGGGGYLDNCSDSGLAVRPFQKIFQKKIEITIDDLIKIGLSGKWLEIAEKVGAEKWLEIWQILDRENINQPSCSRDAMRLKVPAYSKLMKFKRNRYIARMLKHGCNIRQIHHLLEIENIEPISILMIKKIKKDIVSRGVSE